MEITSDSVITKIKNFSDELRNLRNKKEISAREMSLALGQNVNYINLIENGKRKPSLEMFLYICEYLKVSPEYFFQESKKSENIYEQILNNLSENQKEQLGKFILSLR